LDNEKEVNALVYQWKVDGIYPVSAQKAGEEIERIYEENGGLDAATVVNVSRPEDAVLHPCFEWRDPIAAEKWREHQARGLMCCIVTVSPTKNGGTSTTRAFYHVSKSYTPVEVVLKTLDKEEELRKSALRELIAYHQKYKVISELAPVIEDAVKETRRRLNVDETDRASANV